MESLLLILGVGLLLATLIGLLWIALKAFSEDEPLWGVASLIFFPFALVYGLQHQEDLKIPVIMIVVGVVGRISLGLLLTSLG